MKLNPRNRHVLLKEKETTSEEKKSTVLVPDAYKIQAKPYGVYEVVSVSEDCTIVSSVDVQKQVVVNNSMVEKINVEGKELLLVLENHVYGVLDK